MYRFITRQYSSTIFMIRYIKLHINTSLRFKNRKTIKVLFLIISMMRMRHKIREKNQLFTNRVYYFKVCLSFAENGHTVLYLASRPIEKLPSNVQHNTETLRKIFFMYYSTSTDLVKKLLDIHSWNKSPKLIIIESMETFFNCCQTQTYEQLVSMHAMLIGTLHDCVRTFADRQPDGKAFSLVSLNSRRNDCYPRMLSILMDLYYYKKNWFNIDENSLDELKMALELS